MLAFMDKRKNKIEARAIAQMLSQAARQPVFFRDKNVPDTIQGRLDLLVLHLAIASAGLTLHEPKSKKAQAMFDYVLRDIQESFRQIGVGDLAVPHKMKDLMRAANGLTSLMHMHVNDADALASVIVKNVYHNETGREADAQALASYAQTHMTQLMDKGSDGFAFDQGMLS